MNISNYKNLIDNNYFQLSEEEKRREIIKFAIDIYKDLGIPEKHYPPIIFTSKFEKYSPGAFSNKEIGLRRFFDFKHNGVIKLNENIFLNGDFDRENDSIARILYRTIHHEGIHCVQELIRTNRLDSNTHPEFLATKDDFQCSNYKLAFVSKTLTNGDKDIGIGLSYIKCGQDETDCKFDTNFRELIYFSQLEEYDAFTLTDEKVISFLSAMCNTFPNENLTPIENAIDTHNLYLSDKNDRFRDVIKQCGYANINSFIKDNAIIRKSLFLKSKEYIEMAKPIINKYKDVYNRYIKECKKAFKDWIGLSNNSKYIDENITSQVDIKLENNISIIESGALEQAELLRLEGIVMRQLGEPPTEEEITDMINSQQYTNLENSEEIKEEEFDLE